MYLKLVILREKNKKKSEENHSSDFKFRNKITKSLITF